MTCITGLVTHTPTPSKGGTISHQLHPGRAGSFGLLGVVGSPCFMQRKKLIGLCRALQSAAMGQAASSADFSARVETMEVQHTLSKLVTRSGVGLHSGGMALVRLLPAAAGEGKYFVPMGHGKAEGKEDIRLPASVEYVRETQLSTSLGKGNAKVRTVEHLLSALEGMGVDNCRIEIEGGNEVPLLDGSAKDWVGAINEAGLYTAQDSSSSPVKRKALVVQKPFVVQDGDSFVAAYPAPSTRLTYGIDFSQLKAVGKQWFTWCPTDHPEGYQLEVAPARTFGIYEQIEHLRASGLIKGGSLDNALVCSMEGGWLNPPLRFPEEPCRHKLLDLIGDLALCGEDGHPGLPVGHIVAFKASHQLHVKFCRALLQSRTWDE